MVSKWEVSKLRANAEAKACEAAAAVSQFGHEHPKAIEAVAKASAASESLRKAL